MAQSLINIRVVPRFYRTNKFGVLWILFPDHRTGYMVAWTIPLWCPGDDARLLGLLYWLIVYTVRRSFCGHTNRGISNKERITKKHKIKIVSRKTVATVVRVHANTILYYYIDPYNNYRDRAYGEWMCDYEMHDPGYFSWVRIASEELFSIRLAPATTDHGNFGVFSPYWARMRKFASPHWIKRIVHIQLFLILSRFTFFTVFEKLYFWDLYFTHYYLMV